MKGEGGWPPWQLGRPSWAIGGSTHPTRAEVCGVQCLGPARVVWGRPRGSLSGRKGFLCVQIIRLSDNSLERAPGCMGLTVPCIMLVCVYYRVPSFHFPLIQLFSVGFFIQAGLKCFLSLLRDSLAFESSCTPKACRLAETLCIVQAISFCLRV